MADIFHDRAPVMAFLHSVDICMLVWKGGRKEIVI